MSRVYSLNNPLVPLFTALLLAVYMAMDNNNNHLHTQTKAQSLKWQSAIGHFPTNFIIWQSKSNLLGHIYCTFPMDKPLIVYSNVPAFKEWPTNFKLLFQALRVCDRKLLIFKPGVLTCRPVHAWFRKTAFIWK